MTLKKKKHILLLIDTSKAYGRRIIEGISRYALENGTWEIDIEDRGLFEKIPGWVKRWKGDGIITRTATLSQANVLSRFEIPTVELMGDSQTRQAEVAIDEPALTRLACEHFLEQGLVHLAYFSFGNSWWSRRRAEFLSYWTSLHHGVSYHCFPNLSGEILAYPTWHDSQEVALKKWLRELPKPIGIFGSTDMQAVRLIHVCRDIGLSIPNEIAVLGVGNDIMLCNLQTPTLSSIDPDGQKFGYIAAELMERKLKTKTFRANKTIFVPPLNVVQRKTTDLLAIDDPEIAAAIEYIREHAFEPVSVTAVADHVGLSYSTLLRRFSKAFGRTPNDVIVHLRIEQAKKLLQKTSLSTDSIGKRVGFQYPEHFARVFRRLVGMSPNKYRNQLIHINEDIEDR